MIVLLATALAVDPTNQPLLSRLRLQQGNPPPAPAPTATPAPQPAMDLPLVPGLTDAPVAEPEKPVIAIPADKPIATPATPPPATTPTPPASNTSLVEKPILITDLPSFAKALRVPLDMVNRTISGAERQVLLLQPRTDILPEVFSFVEDGHVHFIAQQWTPSDNTTKIHSAWVKEIALPAGIVTRRCAENLLYKVNNEADYNSNTMDIMPAFKEYYNDFFKSLRRLNERVRDIRPIDWLANRAGINRDAYGYTGKRIDYDDDFDDD